MKLIKRSDDNCVFLVCNMCYTRGLLTIAYVRCRVPALSCMCLTSEGQTNVLSTSTRMALTATLCVDATAVTMAVDLYSSIFFQCCTVAP